MDIKLKNTSDKKRKMIRGAAIVLCAALITTSLVSILSIERSNENGFYLEELFTTKEYVESPAVYRNLSDISYWGRDVVKNYKSEEYIKSGGALSNAELLELESDVFRDYYYGIYDRYPYIYEDYEMQEEWNRSQGNDTTSGETVTEVTIDTELATASEELRDYGFIDEELNLRMHKLQEKGLIDDERLEEEYTARKNELIYQQLLEYKALMDKLNKEGILYYFSENDTIVTNTKQAEIRNASVYVISKDGSFECSLTPEKDLERVLSNLQWNIERKATEDSVIMIGLEQSYLNESSIAFKEMRQALISHGAIAIVFLILAIACFVWLIITSGRKDEDGNPIFTGLTRLPSEIILFATIMIFIFSMLITEELSWNYYYYSGYDFGYYYYPTNFKIGVTAGFCFIASTLCITAVLLLIEKIKAKRLFKDSLIVRFCKWLKVQILAVYHSSSVTKKVILLVLATCLLSATILLAPVVAVLAILFALKQANRYEEIKKGVVEMRNGNLSYQIPTEGQGEFSQLAKDINEISDGFDLAVKQEMKNQRMKTELISNVSHDIKTPLTSIISYVDLLKDESLDTETARRYLEILDQKSQRLRILTEDLFEAAKASSGDIPVHLANVNLLSLVQQGMGELNDRLTEQGLNVILNASQEQYPAVADPQLIWRVTENLLNNAIKYALPNSRVYIDLTAQEETVTMAMKNISKDPMNIPADELMERFKRGDESRTSEGSGLGLAIAKDLVIIQHGTFNIVIDGDLFKVVVTLPKYID